MATIHNRDQGNYEIKEERTLKDDWFDFWDPWLYNYHVLVTSREGRIIVITVLAMLAFMIGLFV